MSLSGGKEREPIAPIAPVSRSDKPLEAQQEIEDLISKEQQLAESAIDQKKTVNQENLDQIVRHLPKLIQRTLLKLETSQVYQTFKLPGKDYTVHDRRERPEEGKPKEKDRIADESKQSLHDLLVQKGKLGGKEKNYENYLADPAGKIPLSLEQKVAKDRLSQFLTHFEKTLLKRFEEGVELAKKTAEGQFSFFKKTTDQWHDFFSKFVQRTVKRRVTTEQVQEWVFRGLVQKPSKATVISDWALANGQWERFVRFHLPIDAAGLAQFLAQLNPGTRLSKEDLEKFLQGDLEYLAIKAGEGDTSFVRAAQKGKFLNTASAEEKVANDLGVQLGAQLKEKERLLKELSSRKKGGLKGGSGGLLGEEEVVVEQGTQFVPWWQYGLRKKHTGPTRWFVITAFLVLVALVVIGFLALLNF